MNREKNIEDATRVKYARLLDRFHKSIVSYLTLSANPSKDIYIKKIEANLVHLSKIPHIDLYKSDLKNLESFIKKMVEFKDSDKSIEDIRDYVLYTSNQLQKTQNRKKYKKEKYSNHKDWE